MPRIHLISQAMRATTFGFYRKRTWAGKAPAKFPLAGAITHTVASQKVETLHKKKLNTSEKIRTTKIVKKRETNNNSKKV